MKLSEQLSIINKYRNKIPVDLEAIANSIGLHIQYSFLDSDTSGILEKNKKHDGYTIIVNANDHSNRKRFTIAHELGHYMLHRNLIGSGLDDNRAYRSTDTGKYHNTSIGPEEETEANQFAANLLMPRHKVKELYTSGVTNSGELADKFGVSEQAMSIRLKSVVR